MIDQATLELQRERRQLWIAALRSGKYQQGIGTLRDYDDEFCCLGVACDLYASENPTFGAEWQTDDETRTIVFADGSGVFQDGALPDSVREFFGLAHMSGKFDGGELAELNDYKHFTFAAIADVIESEPEGLVVL